MHLDFSKLLGKPFSKLEKCQWDMDAPARCPLFHTMLKLQGPVVQSIISLTRSLVVKMLTVLVSAISNSQVFLLKKCDKLFSAKILAYMPYLMNKVLTIHQLTTSFVSNNWAKAKSGGPGRLYKHIIEIL